MQEVVKLSKKSKMTTIFGRIRKKGGRARLVMYHIIFLSIQRCQHSLLDGMFCRAAKASRLA